MNMGNEYEIETIGHWDTELTFELNEAVTLIHKEIVKIEDRAYLPNPPAHVIGIICGVLTMNEEIEVVVNFPEGMDQLTKTELCGDYLLVEKANMVAN